jgi:hypothetical protein
MTGTVPFNWEEIYLMIQFIREISLKIIQIWHPLYVCTVLFRTWDFFSSSCGWFFCEIKLVSVPSLQLANMPGTSHALRICRRTPLDEDSRSRGGRPPGLQAHHRPSPAPCSRLRRTRAAECWPTVQAHGDGQQVIKDREVDSDVNNSEIGRLNAWQLC